MIESDSAAIKAKKALGECPSSKKKKEKKKKKRKKEKRQENVSKFG